MDEFHSAPRDSADPENVKGNPDDKASANLEAALVAVSRAIRGLVLNVELRSLASTPTEASTAGTESIHPDAAQVLARCCRDLPSPTELGEREIQEVYLRLLLQRHDAITVDRILRDHAPELAEVFAQIRACCAEMGDDVPQIWLKLAIGDPENALSQFSIDYIKEPNGSPTPTGSDGMKSGPGPPTGTTNRSGRGRWHYWRANSARH